MAASPIKVVLVGTGGVGKTTLLIRYVKFTYPTVYVPCVVDDYKTTVLINGTDIELELLDTAKGCEGPGPLENITHADVVCLCFSIGDPDSLENVDEKWLPEVIEHFGLGTPLVLVGLKKDLRHDVKITKELRKTKQKPVDIEEAERASQRIGAVGCVECSALRNEGVQEVFAMAARAAITARKHRKDTGCIVL